MTCVIFYKFLKYHQNVCIFLQHQGRLKEHLIRTIHVDMAQIISKENRERCIKTLQQMKPLRLKGPMPEKHAAVLVPLCVVQNKLSLLYTVRSTNLRTNRGEVSFPGGMQDKEDVNLVETAIRETEEELGISRKNIDVWGEANFIGTYSGKVAVLPVIGYIGDINVEKLKTNTKEVESVFTLSLNELCDPEVCRHTQFRSRTMVLPLFIGPQHKVWGLTAAITHFVLHALAPNSYTKQLKYIKPIRTN